MYCRINKNNNYSLPPSPPSPMVPPSVFVDLHLLLRLFSSVWTSNKSITSFLYYFKLPFLFCYVSLFIRAIIRTRNTIINTPFSFIYSFIPCCWLLRFSLIIINTLFVQKTFFKLCICKHHKVVCLFCLHLLTANWILG